MGRDKDGTLWAALALSTAGIFNKQGRKRLPSTILLPAVLPHRHGVTPMRAAALPGPPCGIRPGWEAELVDHVLVTALPHSVHWRARYCCSTNTCMNMSANCATSCAAASGASQGALGLHARDARRNFFGIQQLLRVAGSGL